MTRSTIWLPGALVRCFGVVGVLPSGDFDDDGVVDYSHELHRSEPCSPTTCTDNGCSVGLPRRRGPETEP